MVKKIAKTGFEPSMQHDASMQKHYFHNSIAFKDCVCY